jgi:NitT/TauT family transport system ATP-binding protein
MAPKLEIYGLNKVYPGSRTTEGINVFKGIECVVGKGEFLSIVGPSGCGKTTLLRVIAGLEEASSGKILLNGRMMKRSDPRVGMVFQEYALFPWRTLIRNIEVGLEFKGVPKRARRINAMKYVEAFGLEGFENRYPKELSGGMKQRVAIARTLITNPEIVLMDEPFGSLDSQSRNRLQEFLLTIWQRRKDTILFVTHNVDEAVYMSDRIAVLAHRPSSITKIFDVTLKRPRDRTGMEANRLRRRILEMLR